MSTPMTQAGLTALLASLDCDWEQAEARYEQIRRRLIRFFEWRGFESPEDLADETISRVAEQIANGLVLRSDPYAYLSGVARLVAQEKVRRKGWERNAIAARERLTPTPPANAPDRPMFSQVSPLPPNPAPLLDRLRHHLQTRFPLLYAQVLEPTLADLRKEHSAALAENHHLKARWVLLRGCGALAAAAACQLGVSLLGRIATLWQARSPK